MTQFLPRALRLPFRPPETNPTSNKLFFQLRTPRKIHFQLRRYTTNSNPANSAKEQFRLERILSRLPRPLQRYTSCLRNAPVTHVAAFLILHEITAILPLFGLFGLFHFYPDHIPLGYLVSHWGGYVAEGVGRFERWFRRRGWFGFEKTEPGKNGVVLETGEGEEQRLRELWERDRRYRAVVEIALAYAVTKVLLPVRIGVSLWATPWFAGVMMRIKGLFARKS